MPAHLTPGPLPGGPTVRPLLGPDRGAAVPRSPVSSADRTWHGSGLRRLAWATHRPSEDDLGHASTGSLAPCRPSTSADKALRQDGDLRTRRAGPPAPEPTMNGAPPPANRATGLELRNYHIP